jgi:hypothetical protein
VRASVRHTTGLGERNLCAAVVHLALRDLGRSQGADLTSARAFFASRNLDLYCGMLGIDTEAVRERARGIVADARPRSAAAAARVTHRIAPAAGSWKSRAWW